MDELRIDSHKLIYHVRRVTDWLDGRDIYPLYLEVSPAGACNHRCTYCALDYMGYRHRFLSTPVLNERISEMARLGVRSIMFAGEGEPFLHKDIASIINHTKSSGIDVAITSNGVLFNEKLIESTLPSITWIKISINAATKETYARLHRTGEEDFGRVIRNISRAVELRNASGLSATIGMQIILLPENVDEVAPLARKAREIGADYLVVKPYSQHSRSITRKYKDFGYEGYYRLKDELDAISGDRFNVVFRINTMKKLERAVRGYERCMALPFWSYIDSEGGVWGCSAWLGDERFLFGNINSSSFEEVWGGDKRKRALEFVERGLDTSECRKNCRMDEVNRYLWELKNPPMHVNFI
ncbi:MAG TPA: radical SAM protein [Thermodesulfobacteriota bacterium]|nr:radical SAM protein [Thermodesulfobacteriota bacterium]